MTHQGIVTGDAQQRLGSVRFIIRSCYASQRGVSPLAGLAWADPGHSCRHRRHHPYVHCAHNHYHARVRSSCAIKQFLGSSNRHLGCSKSVVAHHDELS
jgi:hypothetical protein